MLPIGALALAFGSCGPAQYSVQLTSFLEGTPARRDREICERRNVDREADIALGLYVPVEFLVHRWPGGLPPGGVILNEGDFVSMLESGAQRLVLVSAHAGVGKIRFADSLEALTCKTMPVIRVDLAHGLGRAPGAGGDTVFEEIAKDLGVATDQAQRAELNKLLRDARWLMVVDALDEVGIGERNVVFERLRDFLSRWPNVVTVVLARAEIFKTGEPLGAFTSVLELPQLDCARADARARKIIGSDLGAGLFARFTARFGFDTRTDEAGRCVYKDMGTYGAVATLVATAKAFGVTRGEEQAAGALGLPRAVVREKWAALALVEGAPELGPRVPRLLDLADRMVAAQASTTLETAPIFSLDACLVQARDLPAAERWSTCERLLRSPLFRDADAHLEWIFVDAEVADQFRARLVEAELSASSKTTPGGHCVATEQRGRLVAVGDVSSYLAGMPRGSTCLGDLARALCSRQGGHGDKVTAVARALDRGMPLGVARKALIDNARKVLANTQSDAATVCARSAFGSLETPAPPPATPPSPPPGKAPSRR